MSSVGFPIEELASPRRLRHAQVLANLLHKCDTLHHCRRSLQSTTTRYHRYRTTESPEAAVTRLFQSLSVVSDLAPQLLTSRTNHDSDLAQAQSSRGTGIAFFRTHILSSSKIKHPSYTQHHAATVLDLLPSIARIGGRLCCHAMAFRDVERFPIGISVIGTAVDH